MKERTNTNRMAAYISAAGGLAASATPAQSQIISATFNQDLGFNNFGWFLDLNTMTLTEDPNSPYESVATYGEWDVNFRSPTFREREPGSFVNINDTTWAIAGASEADYYVPPYTYGYYSRPGFTDQKGDDGAVFSNFFLVAASGFPIEFTGLRVDQSMQFGGLQNPVQNGNTYPGPVVPEAPTPDTGQFFLPMKVGAGYGWVRYEITGWRQLQQFNGQVRQIKEIRIVDAAYNPDGGIELGRTQATTECAADTNGDEIYDFTDLAKFQNGLASPPESFARVSTDIAAPFSRFLPSDELDLFAFLQQADGCSAE